MTLISSNPPAPLDSADSGALARAMAVLYWPLAAVLTTVGVFVVCHVPGPNEDQVSLVQRIYYVHLPVAINTFAACLTVFIASIGFLSHRRMWWDDLAEAAARVAVLLGAIVLLTGMIWGRAAWNTWWTWSPRLTFSLILWLLYVVQLMVRASIESRERRAVISAVYGIIAFLDVPLVYLSAKLIEEMHPASYTMEPVQKWTLALWFVPVTMIAGGLISMRYQLARRISAKLAGGTR